MLLTICFLFAIQKYCIILEFIVVLHKVKNYMKNDAYDDDDGILNNSLVNPLRAQVRSS
jgi:hypothetical protein